MPLLPATHYPQRHPADCLATCARMVLEYIGVQVRYNRLLRLLQVDASEAGASFYQLAQLQSLGVKVNIGDGHMGLVEAHLARQQPLIASVDTRELRYWNGLWRFHAVVVVGIEADTVLLNDPAFVNAPQVVNRTEFESAWLEREYVYASITTAS
jgi:ABC-type bacteriocin/lantibiotic exporter with double-glycine peptidase domain